MLLRSFEVKFSYIRFLIIFNPTPIVIWLRKFRKWKLINPKLVFVETIFIFTTTPVYLQADQSIHIATTHSIPIYAGNIQVKCHIHISSKCLESSPDMTQGAK